MEVGRAEAGASGTVQIEFQVPSVPQGKYPVTAVGGTFSIECGPAENGAFGVLADNLGRPDGGGSLPKTGATVALLLVVGFVLLLIGRSALEAGRRRRFRIAQERRAKAEHFTVHRS
jgi:LPXTG-motif cell wall-anchored protein